MKAGVVPPELPSLRSVGSTGSPLPVEGFEWVYERFPDVWLFSTSGGTDLCTAFVGACPLLPVYAGELQARCLGAAVEAWSEDGRPLVDEVGELVITEPMPSMPIYFWNDEAGSRYRGQLLRDVPGHLAARRLDQDHRPRHGGDLRALGLDHQPRRSPDGNERDLQRGGGRDGRARQPRRRCGRRDDPVRGRARLARPTRWSPRSAAAFASTARRGTCPTGSSQIPEVPRTLSNKKLEVPVKKILLGAAPESAASRDSLANPEALDWIADFRVRAS